MPIAASIARMSYSSRGSPSFALPTEMPLSSTASNKDDLGDYRPGQNAASKHEVKGAAGRGGADESGDS